jgi:hypothetical protein
MHWLRAGNSGHHQRMTEPAQATEILARARQAGLAKSAELFPDELIRTARGIAEHLANVPEPSDGTDEPAHRFAP